MTPETKIFVQLAPDSRGIETLAQLRPYGDPSARLIRETKFHLTVLHIGKLQRIIDAVAAYRHSQATSTAIAAEILAQATIFVQEAQMLLTSYRDLDFQLHTGGTLLLGPQENALAAMFKETPELQLLHRQSLALLRDFLGGCGISQVDTFMAADANLRYAAGLNPHVTLAKGRIEPSCFESVSVNFQLMPLVYEAPG